MANKNIEALIPSNLYDLDMERAILSSILYNEDGLSEIYGIINEGDFYQKQHCKCNQISFFIKIGDTSILNR